MIDLQFDLSKSTSIEVATQLRSVSPSEEVNAMLQGCRGQDHLLAGYRTRGKIQVLGEIGDFGFLAFGEGEATIEGNVGEFLGHSMQSGAIFVHGNAGGSLGALGAGGLISVYGNAGPRVGTANQGLDIVVKNNAGDRAGLGMRSGTVILCGNAGKEMGLCMQGGVIYLRGEAESIAPDVEEVRLREPDKLKIGMLMLKAGLQLTGKEFRVYRHVH